MAKGKDLPQHAMKAQGRSRGITPLIHNLGARREWGLTPRPGRFTLRKWPRYLLGPRVGLDGCVEFKTSWTRRIRTPNRSPRSKSEIKGNDTKWQ
jgi:hypothetical protein